VWLALVCRFAGGLTMLILVTSVSTLVQTITDDDKRGVDRDHNHSLCLG
jgi:hypothetical protein